MRVLLSILTNSSFWKFLCDIILKLGELIKLIIEDKENNNEV